MFINTLYLYLRDFGVHFGELISVKISVSLERIDILQSCIDDSTSVEAPPPMGGMYGWLGGLNGWGQVKSLSIEYTLT